MSKRAKEYQDPWQAKQDRHGRVGSDYQFPSPDKVSPKPEAAHADQEYRNPFRARQDRCGSKH